VWQTVPQSLEHIPPVARARETALSMTQPDTALRTGCVDTLNPRRGWRSLQDLTAMNTVTADQVDDARRPARPARAQRGAVKYLY